MSARLLPQIVVLFPVTSMLGELKKELAASGLYPNLDIFLTQHLSEAEAQIYPGQPQMLVVGLFVSGDHLAEVWFVRRMKERNKRLEAVSLFAAKHHNPVFNYNPRWGRKLGFFIELIPILKRFLRRQMRK